MADVHYSAFEAFQLLAVCAAEYKKVILVIYKQTWKGNMLLMDQHMPGLLK